MYCENCGKKLIRGYQFCIECGTPVPPEETEETEAAAQEPDQTAPESGEMPGIQPLSSEEGTLVFCPTCGMRMQKSTEYCEKCGMKLSGGQNNGSSVPLFNSDPIGGEFSGISDSDIAQIDNFVNNSGLGGSISYNGGSDIQSADALGGGGLAGEIEALNQQFANLNSTASEMPAIGAPAPEPEPVPVQPAAPEPEPFARRVDNFSMEAGMPETQFLTESGLPVINGGEMTEPDVPVELEQNYDDINIEVENKAPVYAQPEERTSIFTEPEVPAPTYTEPEEPAPTYTEPEESTPVYTEPEESAPVYTEPEESTPVYTEPEESTPVYTEPEESTPTYTEPEYSAPTYTEPEEPAPVYTEPEESTPVYTEPEESTPVYTEPEESTPVYTEPEEPAPVYTEPEEPAPVYTEPEESTPTYTEPEVPAPTYTEPEEPTPAYTEPEEPAPVYTEPEESTPTYTEPEESTPAYTEPEEPAPAYTEPEESTPTYTEPEEPTPAYTEPEYSAPAYTKTEEPAPSAQEEEPAVDLGKLVYCRNCGQDMYEKEEVCKVCGAPNKWNIKPLKKSVSGKQQESTEKKPIKLFGVIPLPTAIGGAVVAAGVVALIVFTNTGRDAENITDSKTSDNKPTFTTSEPVESDSGFVPDDISSDPVIPDDTDPVVSEPDNVSEPVEVSDPVDPDVSTDPSQPDEVSEPDVVSEPPVNTSSNSSSTTTSNNPVNTTTSNRPINTTTSNKQVTTTTQRTSTTTTSNAAVNNKPTITVTNEDSQRDKMLDAFESISSEVGKLHLYAQATITALDEGKTRTFYTGSMTSTLSSGKTGAANKYKNAKPSSTKLSDAYGELETLYDLYTEYYTYVTTSTDSSSKYSTNEASKWDAFNSAVKKSFNYKNLQTTSQTAADISRTYADIMTNASTAANNAVSQFTTVKNAVEKLSSSSYDSDVIKTIYNDKTSNILKAAGYTQLVMNYYQMLSTGAPTDYSTAKSALSGASSDLDDLLAVFTLAGDNSLSGFKSECSSAIKSVNSSIASINNAIK